MPVYVCLKLNWVSDIAYANVVCFNESVSHRFVEAGIVPFKDILNLKCMIEIYKIKNLIAPVQTRHLLLWRTLDPYHPGLRSTGPLVVPFCRTAYKQRTFRFYASKLANNLSSKANINFSVPISSFKRQIKELLPMM